MKRIAMLAALAASMVSVAGAQDDGAHRFSLRVGFGQFVDADIRDITGNTTWTGGFGYDLRNSSAEGQVDSIDFDGTSSVGRTSVFSGNSAVVVYGLLYARRMNFAEAGENGAGCYGGLGAGVFRLETDAETVTRIGGKALVGYRFNRNLFFEASYRMVGCVAGQRADHFAFDLGWHF